MLPSKRAMKPPSLRPLLPPPAIRRRRWQKNSSLLSSPSIFAPTANAFCVSTHSSSAPYTTYSPAAHHPAYFPATPSAFEHFKCSKNKPQTRGYATLTPGPFTLQVFNATTKHRQRERSASNAEASRRVDYLRDEVAKRLCERLLVNLTDFGSFISFILQLCSLNSNRPLVVGNLGYQTPLPTYPRSWRQCL